MQWVNLILWPLGYGCNLKLLLFNKFPIGNMNICCRQAASHCLNLYMYRRHVASQGQDAMRCGPHSIKTLQNLSIHYVLINLAPEIIHSKQKCAQFGFQVTCHACLYGMGVFRHINHFWVTQLSYRDITFSQYLLAYCEYNTTVNWWIKSGWTSTVSLEQNPSWWRCISYEKNGLMTCKRFPH